MRKKLALLLALCVAAGTVSMPIEVQEVKAVEVGQEMEEGVAALTDGEVPEGYTPIYDIADLYAIRNAPEDNYILMNDIDMSEDTSPGGDYDCGTGWDSIEEFNGTLDGNGHRIIGMHIFGEFGSDAKVGMFEELKDGAVIKNLGIEDCEINVNCSFGWNADGAIGALASEASYASNGDKDYIKNCYLSGNIIVQSKEHNGDDLVGALIGACSYSTRIENCYNTCQIDCSKAERPYIGGICGYSGGKITECYNIGNIIGAENGSVGGICGTQGDSWEGIVNCKYLRGTAPKGIGDWQQDTTDCVSLAEGQMKTPKVFTGFDFKDVWEIDPYCSYPYPQLKNNRMIKINSVELKTQPSKLTYNQGENLNLDGAAIGITYEDGVSTMIPLAVDMLSGYDMRRIGAQTVTVTYGGRQVSFDIEVKEVPVSDIRIPSSLTLDRSKSKQLSATILPANASDKSVSWESDNPAVASVDKNGVVKAKSRGTAVVIATSANGLQAKCTVTVLVPAVSVQISKTSLTLKEGQSSRITAQALPLESTNTIEWESSNESVAEVYNGTITAKKAGKATIRAYTENGVKASCSVTVQKNYDKEIKKVTSAKAKITSAKNVKGKTIRLKLKRMSDCNGFYIQYGVKKNFKGAKSGTINKKYTIVDIPGLRKGKTYYIRARVYKKIGNKVYYGKWSNVKKVKVKK